MIYSNNSINKSNHISKLQEEYARGQEKLWFEIKRTKEIIDRMDRLGERLGKLENKVFKR